MKPNDTSKNLKIFCLHPEKNIAALLKEKNIEFLTDIDALKKHVNDKSFDLFFFDPRNENIQNVFYDLDIVMIHNLQMSQITWGNVIVRKDDKFYLRNMWVETLIYFFKEKIGSVDFSRNAYIISSPPWMSALVHVCSQLGFRKVFLAGEKEHLQKGYIEQLKKVFFNIEIVYLPMDALTSQASDASLLVTQTDYFLTQDWEEDLAYLNFLMNDSCVLSLGISEDKPQWIQESRQAGHKTFDWNSVGSWTFEKFLTLV